MGRIEREGGSILSMNNLERVIDSTARDSMINVINAQQNHKDELLGESLNRSSIAVIQNNILDYSPDTMKIPSKDTNNGVISFPNAANTVDGPHQITMSTEQAVSPPDLL